MLPDMLDQVAKAVLVGALADVLRPGARRHLPGRRTMSTSLRYCGWSPRAQVSCVRGHRCKTGIKKAHVRMGKGKGGDLGLRSFKVLI